MTYSNTEIFKALSQGLSIDEVVRCELEKAMNHLLQTELTVFLDYEKHDPIGYNSRNSRNGSYNRAVDTKYGTINVTIPRDSNGEFKQQVIPPHTRRTNDLETTVLHLYSKGVTTSEIADLIDKMYGHAYSPQTISNITRAVESIVEAYHSRPLNKRFVALFGDVTMLNVRRDGVAKEALHIIVGITPEGYKKVLDYRLYPTESASNYADMLEDLKRRALEEVLLVVTDGLTGIREAYLRIFPKAKHKSCWVHVQRNIAKLVRVKDRKEVMDLMKELYTAEDKEVALEVIDEKIKKRYPKVITLLDANQSLYSFYAFPKSIRSSLYTTNLLEGLNKQLKRQTKKKEQFPNEASLERFVCDYMLHYKKKFSSRVHKGFNVVQLEINEMFESTYC